MELDFSYLTFGKLTSLNLSFLTCVKKIMANIYYILTMCQIFSNPFVHTLFNLHNNSVRLVVLLHLTGEETEVQRSGFLWWDHANNKLCWSLNLNPSRVAVGSIFWTPIISAPHNEVMISIYRGLHNACECF